MVHWRNHWLEIMMWIIAWNDVSCERLFTLLIMLWASRQPKIKVEQQRKHSNSWQKAKLFRPTHTNTLTHTVIGYASHLSSVCILFKQEKNKKLALKWHWNDTYIDVQCELSAVNIAHYDFDVQLEYYTTQHEPFRRLYRLIRVNCSMKFIDILLLSATDATEL